MIRQVEISTMEQLFRFVSEQKYRPELGGRYRDQYIYRGEPDANFVMSTSLRRNCKEKSRLLEAHVLRNFTKYAILEEPTIGGSVWQQMMLGQHHGLPTRLLDWSFSPLMALHFATDEKNLDDMSTHDSVVWRLDIHEIHALLPENYQAIMRKYRTTIFTVEMLEEVCTSVGQYDRDMQKEALVVVEPPSLDPRIINQYSFFTIVPDEMTDIEAFLNTRTQRTVRYIIRKDLRWRVRDMLDHQNINERIVYPGLDGLSKWLGRHYFVKEEWE